MPWNCNFCSCFKPEVDDIQILDYNHHSLKEVPADVFAHERTLEELNLEANRIKDLPRALFHCHGLRVLNLSDNDIKTMPPAIASLINLQHLNLSKNSLSDIPDNIKCCKQLVYVNVSVNPLEKLPEGFTQLIALEELYLNDTFLEFLPATFGRLSKLRVLDLRENNLNTLPKSIARLANLQVLDIGRNEFSDLPEVIGSLPELRDLWVDYNKIRCIPQFIGHLQNLRNFDVSNNNVQWIAAEIEDCVHLNFLVVSSNELQTVPEEIGNLKELTMLKLDDNDLEVLPSSIGKLTNLEELVISQNVIELLPPTIGLLRKVEIINADDNRLSELPSELCSCTSLRILSVRNNMLDMMPAEVGHLAGIHVINVADNLLINLPVSILNLSQLTALWLSTNQTTPLTTLQKEVDPRTGQTVCVNFMFPQVEQERNITHVDDDSDVTTVPVERSNRPHIRFADSAELRHPSRLTRAPTPYPKELRSMAKHARILVTRPLQPQGNSPEHMPLLGELSSGSDSRNVTIKTATVKKPVTTSMGDASYSEESIKIKKTSEPEELGSVSDTSVDQSPEMDLAGGDGLNQHDGAQQYAERISSARHADSPKYTYMMHDERLYEERQSLLEHTEPSVLTLQSNTNEQLSKPFLNGSVDEENELTSNEKTVTDEVTFKTNPQNGNSDVSKEVVLNGIPEQPTAKHPPPYHIAAVYSKQAAFFRNVPFANNYSATLIAPVTDQYAASPSVDAVVTEVPSSHVPVEHMDISPTEVYLESVVTSPSPATPLVVDSPVVQTPTKPPPPVTELPAVAAKCRIPVSVPKESAIPTFTKLHDTSPDKSVAKSIPTPSKLPGKSLSKIPSFSSKESKSPPAIKPAGVTPTRMLQPGFHTSSHVATSRPGSIAPPIGVCDNDLAVNGNHGSQTASSVSDLNNSNGSELSLSPTLATTPSFKSRIPSLVSPGKNSPTWVFGQHKNPTVFPVMIVKNPGLGFSIGGGSGAEKQENQGIYVTKVHPGGPASSSLAAGDKILEVDGIDFAKLEHDQAVGILTQTKNVVTMMISRQK